MQLSWGNRISLYDVKQFTPLVRYGVLAILLKKEIPYYERYKLRINKRIPDNDTGITYELPWDLDFHVKTLFYSNKPNLKLLREYLVQTGFHSVDSLLIAFCNSITRVELLKEIKKECKKFDKEKWEYNISHSTFLYIKANLDKRTIWYNTLKKYVLT
jgi:hypothetical protein